MNEKVLKILTWQITKNYQDYDNVLYWSKDLETGISKYKYFSKDVGNITNIKEIFERVVKDFEISDEDLPCLFGLLSNFSIDNFLNCTSYCTYNYNLYKFLTKYNFKIGINKQAFNLDK